MLSCIVYVEDMYSTGELKRVHEYFVIVITGGMTKYSVVSGRWFRFDGCHPGNR